MDQHHNEILKSAEELLAARFGGDQQLSHPEDLGGSGFATVLRFRVAHNPFLTERSVVVKQMPESSATGVDPSLLREIVAYQFTTSLSDDVRPGPVLLAYDVDKRLLVISDLGDAHTFASLLAENERETDRMPVVRSLGKALGMMHEGSAMREEDFNTLLRRLWSKHRHDPEVAGERDRGIIRSINLGVDLLEALGVPVTDGVRKAAAEAARRNASGYHRAFTPFDLSPDNILMTSRVHFLDYEWAGFRDVAFDVASVCAGFPMFPFTAPLDRDEARVFIDTWHAEVRRTWPDLGEGDNLQRRITVALLGWLLISAAAVHSGSAEAILSIDADAPIDPEVGIGGGPRERADLAQTARVLSQFAADCADGTFDGLVELAEGVVALVSED